MTSESKHSKVSCQPFQLRIMIETFGVDIFYKKRKINIKEVKILNFYALSIGGIAAYLLIGLIVGLYVANDDKKRYGDNRYRREDLIVFVLIGVPTLITMLLAVLTSGCEDLLQSRKNRKPKDNLCLPHEETGDL